MKETTPKKLHIATSSWVKLAAIAIAVYGLYLVSDFILVLITSVIIASAVEPVAVWAKKREFPRLPAVLGVYVLSAIVLLASFYFVLLPLLGETTDFVRNMPSYAESVSTNAVTPVEGEEISGISSSFSIENLAAYLNSLVDSFSQGVFSTVSLVFGGVLSFVLIIVLSFYLAVQEDGVGKFLEVIVPFKHEKYTVGLWRRSQRKIGFWMQGQLLLVIIIAVLTYLGLLLIGLPNALLLAVLAGLFEIIPLFGPVIAAIPALFVAFAEGGTSLALIVAGLYLIIQQFENHLIYPLVVKKVVGVPPMVSIIALVVGGQLAGFLGMIIAVPIAAVIMELLSDLEKEKAHRIEAMSAQK